MTKRVGSAVYGGSFETDAGVSLAFVAPGEQVDDANGLLTILEPSPHRVDRRCVHFGTCGGCQYQHLDYPAQLEIKGELLLSILSPASQEALPALATSASEPWAYRNRIRLRVGLSGAGLSFGYSLRGSNDFLPITMCPLAAPLLWRAAQLILDHAAQHPVAARWLQATSELELFCGPEQDRLQLQLFLREAGPAFTSADLNLLCASLRAPLPELKGVGALLHPDASRRARLDWPGLSWGAPGLLYQVAGRDYWVSRGAFFQVDRFLVEPLLTLVTGGRSGRLAWDLYAGVGLFTRALADSFDRVVAVEGAPAAASDLAILARANPAIAVRHQNTLDFLKESLHQRECPDLIVLDPPRAGLAPGGAALLARIAAPEIVYVSCDPTTLTRDLTILLASGYSAQRIHLVDLFPQTFHLETVVHLRRTSGSLV